MGVTHETCNWELDDNPEYTVWTSDCGNEFMFETDGPEANGFEFCPYCELLCVESPVLQRLKELK